MTTTPTTSIVLARFRDLSQVDCLDVALTTLVSMHEVLAQKVAEKKAAAEAAAAELATYLKVQAAMTQKLSGQIGTLMAEQDLAQAATSGAVT